MTIIKIIGNIAVFVSGFMAFLTGVGLMYYGFNNSHDKAVYPSAVIIGACIILSYSFVIMYVSILLSMLNGR